MIRKLDFPVVKINDFKLDTVNHSMYLGVTLVPYLAFGLHLNAISRVSEKGYLLRRITPYLDSQTRLMIYWTMVLPYAKYGDIF